MKLYPANVSHYTYTEDSGLQKITELKYGFESISDWDGDEARFVFIVPAEKGTKIEHRDTMTSVITEQVVAYCDYEICSDMEPIDVDIKRVSDPTYYGHYGDLYVKY